MTYSEEGETRNEPKFPVKGTVKWEKRCSERCQKNPTAGKYCNDNKIERESIE